MKQLRLDTRMGEAVLDRLSQLAPLPQDGLLAGQSVASALFDLHDGSGGVYNDLDVFRATGQEARHSKALTTARFSGITVSQPWNPGYMELTAFMKYRVEYTQRDGLLNTVFIRNIGIRRLTPHTILNTFDFNCVQVGVHLPTKRLVWTPQFEHFCRTRQLELASVHTPWHSAIRLFKKLHELKNVWCDVESSMDLLSSLAVYNPSWIPRNFGGKSAELFRAFETDLGPYFSLDSRTFNYRDARDEAQLFEGYTLTARRTASELATQVAETLGDARWALAPQLYYARQRVPGKKAASREALLSDWLQKPQQVGRHNDSRFFHFFHQAVGPRYLETGQISENNLSLVKKAIDDHGGLATALLGFTLDEQLRIVKLLKKLAKEYGEFVWGLAETSLHADAFLWEDEMRRLIEDHRARLSENLVTDPLSLPETLDGFTLKELKTALELEEEGATMHHCVGGYADAVKQNRSRIIQIRRGTDKKDWSTVEVRAVQGMTLGAKAKLTVAQQRGVSNCTPSKESATVLNKLMALHGYTTWDRVDTRFGISARVAHWVGRLSRLLLRSAHQAQSGYTALLARKELLDRAAEIRQKLEAHASQALDNDPGSAAIPGGEPLQEPGF